MNDLTEDSLEELCAQMRSSFTNYRLVPTRFVVPAWVIREIEEQYGAPVTEVKYHQWNAKRLGL
jgi:hypothetical protein